MLDERGIIVAIRKRPLGKKEISKGDQDIVERRSDEHLVLKELRCKIDLTKYTEEHSFCFDAVFDERANNQEIYSQLIQPLVDSAFNKSKVNVFAYGQTGSGKTYTMMGDPEKDVPGLYLLAAQEIFSQIDSENGNDLTVGISFFEIYCGKAYDLLNNRESCFIRVDAKENVNIVGLTETEIKNTDRLMALIHFGLSVRVTGQTGMNDESSRSHAILQITLRTTGRQFHGRMSFIDLAGSERGADVTDTNKQTRLDGAEINKSLLALKECIRALDQDKKFLPFRGSKLTMVLKDSFIGNCKTVMIGNISPSSNCSEQSLNTLRYADRVKELKKGKEKGVEKDKRDELAKQLMLPRMNKNANKIMVPAKSKEDFINFEPDIDTESKSAMIPKPVKTLHPLSTDRRGESPTISQNASESKLINPRTLLKMNPSSSQPRTPLFKRADAESMDNNRASAIGSKSQSSLIDAHNTHIDKLVNLVKEDMTALNNAKSWKFDLGEYIHMSEKIIHKKLEAISAFKYEIERMKRANEQTSKVPPRISKDFDLLNNNDFDDDLI